MDERQENRQGIERLAFFSDAVVAISLTLLIVPLVEAANDQQWESAVKFLQDNRDQLLAFGVSFAVIAALWTAHHRVFAGVVDYSPTLRFLVLAWLFTVAFLPLPTALTAIVDQNNRSAIALYIGTMTLSSLALLGQVIVIRQDQELRGPGVPANDRSYAGALTTTALFALAFIIGVTFPSISYFALFVLFLGRLIEPVVYRRIASDPS